MDDSCSHNTLPNSQRRLEKANLHTETRATVEITLQNFRRTSRIERVHQRDTLHFLTPFATETGTSSRITLLGRQFNTQTLNLRNHRKMSEIIFNGTITFCTGLRKFEY